MTKALAILAAVVLLAQAQDQRNDINTCTPVVVTNPDGTKVYTSECPPPVEPDSRRTASPF